MTLPPIDPQKGSVFFDASLWGAGVVLLISGCPAEFLEHRWTPPEAASVGATIGTPASQTVFEHLALYLALRTWADKFAQVGFAILGDNVASLGFAVNFKGRKSHSQISREIAWRRVRRSWRYAVAHVPSEQNSPADALSRTCAPTGSEHQSFPEEALRAAAWRRVPDLDHWWLATR